MPSHSEILSSAGEDNRFHQRIDSSAVLLLLLPLGSLLLHLVNILWVHRVGVSIVAIVFPATILPSVYFALRRKATSGERRLGRLALIALVLIFLCSPLIFWV